MKIKSIIICIYATSMSDGNFHRKPYGGYGNNVSPGIMEEAVAMVVITVITLVVEGIITLITVVVDMIITTTSTRLRCSLGTAVDTVHLNRTSSRHRWDLEAASRTERRRWSIRL